MTANPGPALSGRGPASATLAAALLIWWLGSPYLGFSHDALFYTADALNRLGLADLRTDPFFAHGSQGDYSIFMLPYTGWISWLGVEYGALSATLAARMVWLASLAWMANALLPSGRRWPALVLALLLPAHYDPFGVFAYGEPFASPRPWAEALGLMAIATAARRHVTFHGVHSRFDYRGLKSAALTLLACAIHPLMGLPVATFWIWQSSLASESVQELRPRAIRWLRRTLPLLALAAVALGAAIGLPLLDRFGQHFDPAWWRVVCIRNAVTVAQLWPMADGARLLIWPILLALVWQRSAPGSPQRRSALALGLTMSTLLAAWILGSLNRDVLLVQIQPWRVLWLVQLLTPMLWLGSVSRPQAHFGEDPRPIEAGPESKDERVLSRKTQDALVLAALLTDGWNSLTIAGLAGLLAMLPTDRISKVTQTRCLVLAWSLLALIGLAGLANLSLVWNNPSLANPQAFGHWLALAREPAVGLLLLALVNVGLRGKSLRWITPIGQTGATLTGLASLVLGAALWTGDALSHLPSLGSVWQQHLAQQIPPTASVYWPDETITPWLGLHRSQYAGQAQAAGALFSRQQALDLQQRLQRLQRAGLRSGSPEWPVSPAQTPASVDAARLRWLCQDPSLDFLLLPGDWPLGRTLSLSGASSDDPRQRLSVIDCRFMRPGSSNPTPDNPDKSGNPAL